VDPFTTSGRWLQFGASGVALAICIVVAATAGRGWSWSFFGWGVVAGAIGICGGPLIQRWSDSAISRRTHEQVSEEQRQRRRKWRPFYVTYAGCALAVAILAAGLRSIWPDVLLSAWVLLVGLVLPVAAMRMVLNRLPSRRTGTD
jgi:hypothetical protein